MTQHSTIDTAYAILSNAHAPLSFETLWQSVLSEFPMDEKLARSKKPKLYSAMMLDPRFTSLKDNTWDLAERVKFEQRTIDTSEIELDDDEEEMEEEDILDADMIEDEDHEHREDDEDEDY